MILTETNDQLLSTIQDGYLICHCIALDCSMKNGISFQIQKTLQTGWRVDYYCRQYAHNKQNSALGTAFKTGHHPLYSLFVKKKNYEVYTTTYETYLRQALDDLRRQMIVRQQYFLAMPKLGCGRDRGNWEEIKQIIVHTFHDTDINIKLCL